MHLTTTTVRWLTLGLALGAGGDALAQRAMYRCTSDGRAYLSDRPCEGGPSTGLAAIGPAREARSSYPTDGSVAKASDFLQYLSPACAEFNEGLRNGPARGLGARTMGELRSSYQERCSDDERAARKRLAEEQGRRREARDRELVAEHSEKERARLSREQCDEMYRILHGKRAKVATMSPGELSDFQRFEANWQARCKSG